jgi:hypothetical protein
MGLEGVAHALPGGVDALVEEGFFDRDEKVEGQQAKKNVGLHAMFEVMEDWRGSEVGRGARSGHRGYNPRASSDVINFTQPSP